MTKTFFFFFLTPVWLDHDVSTYKQVILNSRAFSPQQMIIGSSNNVIKNIGDTTFLIAFGLL